MQFIPCFQVLYFLETNGCIVCIERHFPRCLFMRGTASKPVPGTCKHGPTVSFGFFSPLPASPLAPGMLDLQTWEPCLACR